MKFLLHFFVTYLSVLLVSQSLTAQTYQYYFGNLHAHSAFSDGNVDSATSHRTTPLQDYDYAKNSLCFDFLGISEHNHSTAGMHLPDYAVGLSQANTANQDGSFVAMFGMEWGVISLGGHVIIYGYNQLIGWQSGNYNVYNNATDYKGLFKKVARMPGAFAYLAHPDAYDFDSLANEPLNLTSDSAIVGTAIRTGPAFSTDTTYSNASFFSYEPYYQSLLSKGYHLGAGLDHDNHNTTFGRTTHGRLAILAPSLTRANVMDAMKNMRFYSTDDCNVKINFNLNSQVMGSILTNNSNPILNVIVTDPDLESTSSIKVYYGVPGSGVLPTLLTSNTHQNSLSYTHSINTNDNYYYYAKITQSDGNMMITSPIWFTKTATPLAIEDISFQANYENNHILLNWNGGNWVGNGRFLLEKSQDNVQFENLAEITNNQAITNYNYQDLHPYLGESYYRLSLKNANGETQIIGTQKVNNTDCTFRLKLYPQPSKTQVTMVLDGQNPAHSTYQLSIYDVLGDKVYSLSNFSQFPITIPLESLPSSVYFYHLSSDSQLLDVGKIWKE